jgi:hypothetical protein
VSRITFVYDDTHACLEHTFRILEGDQTAHRRCFLRQWWPLPILRHCLLGARHQHSFHQWWVLPDLRCRLPRGAPSTIFASMVGAPGSLASPPRGPAIDIFCVNRGRSRIFNTGSEGPLFHQWWALPSLQHRIPVGPPSTFLTSMVGAPRSSASPPRGPTIDVLFINGGCS